MEFGVVSRPSLPGHVKIIGACLRCWGKANMKMKKLRWLCMSRSKVLLIVLSFIAGYLFHFLMSMNGGSFVKIPGKEFSSHLTKYNDAEVLLVVLILSGVVNVNRRDTLRETWLSNISSENEIKFYFVISLGNADETQRSQILKEQNKHNDLLIFPNLEESFYLLTPKLIASFGWLTDTPVLQDEGKSENKKPFQNFKFLLKCDDDSFVRLPEIVHELKTTYSGQKGENLYWGFFDGRAKAKKSGKYKEDQWDICDYYIPYALGGGYVLARPLVHYIARNGDYLKKYKSEDVSVGAWLSSYADLNRVHDPRFDTEYISRGCHHSYLITHKHSETAIRNFHNNLKNTGRLCQKEFKTRMSYIYNWDAVPSKCCARLNPKIP